MRDLVILAGAVGLVLASGVASGQDYPKLTVEAELSLQSEKTVRKGDAKNIGDTFAEVEAGIGLFLTSELSLQSTLKFEPVRSTTETRFFEDEGLFVEEIYLNFERDWLRLYAGKFNPPFGTAWDRLSELFQKSFAEDYERTEAIGIGGAVTLETLSFGTHSFGATLFHADNTFLSNSAFARPKFERDDTDRVRRNHRYYGGSSNTHDFSSYTFTLDGDSFRGLEGLSYHLGYSRLAKGITETDSEKGYVGALQWAFDLGNELTLTPLVEVGYFRNLAGTSDHATYLTTAVQLDWGPWTVAAMRTGRRLDEPSDGSGTIGRDHTDSLVSLLFGYRFDFGVEAQVAWKREKVEGESTLDALGIRITYELHF